MKQHIKLNNQIMQNKRTLCALSVDVESSSISKSSKSAPSVGDSAVCEGCTNPASADNAVAAAAAAAVLATSAVCANGLLFLILVSAEAL
jgi:hypothetical protein